MTLLECKSTMMECEKQHPYVKEDLLERKLILERNEYIGYILTGQIGSDLIYFFDCFCMN